LLDLRKAVTFEDLHNALPFVRATRPEHLTGDLGFGGVEGKVVLHAADQVDGGVNYRI
jgi:hypothetical protein